MPDAYAIFAGNPDKHQYLKALWPDLYDALAARTIAAPTSPRVRPCELRTQHPGGSARPPAVARISEGGPAACRECLRVARPDNPTGYPI